MCVRVFCLLLLLVTHLHTALAAVPQVIHPVTGAPIRWANPKAITYWLDPGPLGRLTSPQARELVEAMMGVWEDVETADLHFEFAGFLPTDVERDNIGDYVNGSVCTDDIAPKIPSMERGESPIIFDHDGQIIELLVGKGASRHVVGRSGYRCYNGSLADPKNVSQAFVIMNGRFIDGTDDPADLSTNAYAGILLHELGHFLGLHHSMVNETIFHDLLYRIRGAADSRFIPVMYPLVYTENVAGTVLKPDDVVAISTLYPTATFAATQAQLSGIIFDPTGHGFRGANVVARRQDDPWCRAVSTVSGRFCTPLVDSRGATSLLGDVCRGTDRAHGTYRLDGLEPGNYTIEVEEVTVEGGARANMFPETLGADLPGDAEYYNIGDSAKEDGNLKAILQLSPGKALANLEIYLGTSNPLGGGKSVTLPSYGAVQATPCVIDPVNYDQLLTQVVQEPTPSENPTPTPPTVSEAGGGCALLGTVQTPPSRARGIAIGVGLLILGLSRYVGHRRVRVTVMCCVLFFVARAEATTFIPVAADALADAAGLIFQGTCIDLQRAMDDHGLVVTDVTYAVTQMIKGMPARTLTFRVAGDVGNPRDASAALAGIPPFTIGHEDILFLYPASAWGLTSPVGGPQGWFPIRTTADGAQFVRNPFVQPERVELGKEALGDPQPAALSPRQISPEALLQRVADYIRHHPTP